MKRPRLLVALALLGSTHALSGLSLPMSLKESKPETHGPEPLPLNPKAEDVWNQQLTPSTCMLNQKPHARLVQVNHAGFVTPYLPFAEVWTGSITLDAHLGRNDCGFTGTSYASPNAKIEYTRTVSLRLGPLSHDPQP